MQLSSQPAKLESASERPSAAEGPPEVRPAQSAACLNCGTPLTGPFCAACGQRDVPPYPTVRELAIDAFWELSGWDGRFALSVRTLFRRPGMLTREFLEGRRARYVSPLRLYLMASLVYFLLAAAAPDLERPTQRDRAGVEVGGVNVRVGPARREDSAELTPEDKATVLAELERASPVMRPFLRRVVNDPEGLKRGIFETLPRMFFVLLPVFAGIVALFYRGRRYPEHLYFSIHLHAFVFVILAVPELVSFTRSAVLADAVALAATIAIPVYATLAFRHVYGGSIARALAKEVGIAVVYGATTLVAFIVTLYWVAARG